MHSRVLQPELMEQPDLEAARHHAALRGLRRLNAISRSASVVRRALMDLVAGADRPVRVLDVATGAGDLPIALGRWARRHDRPLVVDGCDISPTAIDHARRSAGAAGMGGLRFFRLDALTDPLPSGYDAVVCSLFLHHLDDEQCVDLLGRAGAVAGRIVVNDLLRSRFNLWSVGLVSRLLTRSEVVHTDAARSIRAAFTPGELEALARRAGLSRMTVRHSFPARLVMTVDCR